VSGKKIDVALIGVTGGLLIVAMMPTGKLFSSSPRSAAGDRASSRSAGPMDPGVSASVQVSLPGGKPLPVSSLPVNPTAAPPGAGDGGLLFPARAGTEWVYQVTGPEKIVPSGRWTERIVSEPDGETPGMVEVGFGGARSLARLYAEGGSFRFDGLPFTAPLEMGRPSQATLEGELIPHPARLVEGAVWTMKTSTQIVHKYRDKEGVWQEQEAAAVQTDRAQAGKFEPVVVPAGRFGAHRVSWISRISIEARGRPVLEALTTDPYRRETMWLSPGVGVVRRIVEYLRDGRTRYRVLLELSSFSRPDDR
jgi:hypothetical protein